MEPVFCRPCNCRHPEGEHTSLTVKVALWSWNFYFAPLWQLAQGPFGLFCGSILILALGLAILGPTWERAARLLLNIWLILMFASILAPFFVKYLPPRLFRR
jgi:hypothetical protein